MGDAAGRRGIARCGLARAMVVVFVLLTAVVSLMWAHEKLLSQDEMYAFQTDSVGSVGELVQVQRLWPISLDPLLYHLLSHEGMAVFGVGAFALRLPALLGFLLMQVCLFFFVRNMAGERAGAVAAGFPALLAALYYSAEGRPYGLMLGLYALALWCWQASAGIRGQEPGTRSRGGRGWALVGLAVAIAATINSHYFGVLVLVPVGAGEAWRTVERRKIDWPMVGAIGLGMTGFVGTMPFLKGAAEFKKHYYNAGTVGLHDISRAYRSIFVDYTKMSMTVQHGVMVGLVVFAAALVWGCWRVWRHEPTHRDGAAMNGAPGIGEPQTENAEWVAVLALAALPFCGYLMGRFVTHSIEVRYVLGAAVALSAMVGIALSPWLRRDGVFATALVMLGVGIVATGVARVRGEERVTAARMASLELPAEVRAELAANRDGRLYVQDMGTFEEERYYEPDADVRARMTLVYSEDEELRWNRHNTMALTAEHLQHFTWLPIAQYEALRAVPGEHLFVLQHTGWDWTDEAFAQDGAQVRQVGKALTGDVAAVRFR